MLCLHCLSVYHMHVSCLQRPVEGIRSPGTGSCRRPWATCVGTESSGRTASALNHWATSPVHMLLCISFIFCCCDKYPVKSTLRDKGIIRLLIPSYRLQRSEGVKNLTHIHSQEQRTNTHMPTRAQLSLHYRSACPENGATHSGWIVLPQHNLDNPTQISRESLSETFFPGD